MTAMRQDRNLTQVVIGLSVLAAGVLFSLDKMGYVDVGALFDYWPLILIAIGAGQIVQARCWSAYGGAVIWVLVGAWLLGRTTGVIRVGVGDIWPLILALLGAYLVFRGWQGYDRSDRSRSGGLAEPRPVASADLADDGWAVPGAPSAPPPLPRDSERRAVPPPPPAAGFPGPRPQGRTSDTMVNLFVVMGGVTRRPVTNDFRGGTAVAIMGGCKIDLRNAAIAQSDAVIDVLAFWGGIEIRVPDGWTVVPQVFPFMGGFDDRTTPSASPGPRLIVRGLAFMGGVEVKH